MDTRAGHVRVAVRVRSLLEHEEQEEICLSYSENCIHLFNWKSPSDTLKFRFDACYSEDTSQKDIFEKEVKCLLHLPFKGLNATCFAYGPTGAGKTFTMQGTREEPGIIPRSVKYLYQVMKRKQGPNQHFSLSLSFLEIYQEKVYDLLEPKDHDLPILQDHSGAIVVPELAEVPIPSIEEFGMIYRRGLDQRATQSTALNEHSSRSHAILSIKIQSSVKTSKQWLRRVGFLHLIDLAGSEDNRKTGNVGDRMKESTAINKSLFALNQVVEAINKKQFRIPYRESKLTRLLQEALGGQNVAKIITCLCPSKKMYFNTYHTLNFAAKSRQVVNKPFEAKLKKEPSLADKHSLAQPNQASSSSTSSTSAETNNALTSSKQQAAQNENKRPLDDRSNPLMKSNKDPTKAGKRSIFIGNGFGKQGKTTAELEKRVQQLEAYMTDIMLTQLVDSNKKQQHQEESTVSKFPSCDSMTDDQKLKVVRSIIKVAKAFKNTGDVQSSLRHYEEALVLLPTHEGLRCKVQALRDKLTSRSNDSTASSRSLITAATSNQKLTVFDEFSCEEGKSKNQNHHQHLQHKEKQILKGYDSTSQQRQKSTPTTMADKAFSKSLMRKSIRKPLKPLQHSNSQSLPVSSPNCNDPTWTPEHCEVEDDKYEEEQSEMRCRKKIKAKKVSTRKKTGDDWEHPRKRTKEVIQEIPISLLQLLNTANEKELMSLQGIGKKRAQAILMWREAQGGLNTVGDLHECGLSSAIVGRLAMVCITRKNDNLVSYYKIHNI